MDNPHPPSDQPPLTAKQAAAELGISLRTLGRWVDAGTINAWHKLPGPDGKQTRLFHPDDVARLKQARTYKPPAA